MISARRTLTILSLRGPSVPGRKQAERKGLREHGGSPFRSQALVACPVAGSVPCAVYVQDLFKRLGIHMEITIADVSVVGPRIKN